MSAESLYEDARMKLKRGETSSALQEADQGLKRFTSENSEWHWRFLVLKAEVFDSQGLEQECLSLLEREMPPSLATSDVAVRRKFTQGIANAFLRHFADADHLLLEAETLAKASHPRLLGEVFLRRGTFHFIKDEMPAAESDYGKALQLAREEKDSFLEASALSGMGVSATREGHYDEAIGWNRSASDLARSLGATGSLERTLGNTGWNYIELGDFENALKFYEQAKEASVKGGLLTEQTRWSMSIAYAHEGLSDDAAAEAMLQQTLPLARTEDDKELLAQCLTQLAWIAVRAGRLDLAEEYNKQAMDVEKNGLGPRLAIDSMLLRGAVAASRHNYGEAEKSFLAVAQEKSASPFQQWKAQAGLGKAYANEGLDSKAEDEFCRSLKTSESVRVSVQSEESRLFFLTNTIIFYNDFVEFLVSRNRTEDALQVAELSRARTLAEGLGAGAKTPSFPLAGFHPQKIAQQRKATLLVYWLAPERSYLWVITPAKMGFFTLPKQSEIEALVSEYRSAMQAGKDLLSGGGIAGQKLYSMLAAPAMKMIPRNSRVIVLPDAKLYGLNFEALIVPGTTPHYWIEDVNLSTASSLTLLTSSATRATQTRKRLLLVGNTEQPNNDFPALAQAPVEMKNIEQYFPGANRTVLEGKQATPAAYLSSNPERFSYLHFVTHGTASVTHPLESAVILSPDGGDGGSYKLYAREIVQHRINANLVTISACNGAGTRSYSGEGLVGLSWAFVRAGAHNVIASLWEVSDSSAPQLMDSLYAELSQGRDPATALRDAKLAMLQSHSSDVFKKPYYWAPFQLYVGP